MSEFADLVSSAVNPSMTRAEREAVYGIVKQAVRRLQETEGLTSLDPRTALHQHLVEETIRDVEADIARFVSMEKLDRALAAQNADYAASSAR